MKFKIIVFFLAFVISAEAQSVWNKVSDESEIAHRFENDREIVPSKYQSFKLDYEFMKFKLSDAPMHNEEGRWERAVLLDLPLPDGSVEQFKFVEHPVMSPRLSAKFPNTKTFKGVSTVDPFKRARIDFTATMGFHASISTLDGPIYVDPYFFDVDEHYISYYTKDDIVPEWLLNKTCGADDYLNQVNTSSAQLDFSRGYEDPVVLRTYKLAVSCTGEWGRIFGTVDAVMDRMVTGVNRCNDILLSEASIFFELVDNNDELIFLDPDTDPFDPGNGHEGRAILGQNTNVINARIGQNAYDIGHVFTVGCTDGIAGVAQFGSVCAGNKGAGVSCVGSANIAAFMVNTTTHEIGHQFACGHTWSNCPSSQDQYAAGTAFEPGSGETILSYAGACGNQNLAPTNFDTYHSGTLEQMYNFMTQALGDNCGTLVESDNHCPILNIPAQNGKFIPIQTPFELIGEAEDPDGDEMRYSWEQIDAGVSDYGNFSFSGPQFAVLYPNNDPVRTLPKFTTLINPGSTDDDEVMPQGSRKYNWRFTVRDLNPDNGIASWEDFNFESTSEAGPFVVTHPSTLIDLEVGSELTVEWDVANTDQAPVNAEFVDILISKNAGNDFDYLVATQTPNDGSETIIVPNAISTLVRVKVKAVDNIFFNISSQNIRIVEPSEPGFYLDLGYTSADVCLPEILEIPIMGTSFQDFAEPIDLSVTGLPAGAVATFDDNPLDPAESTTLRIDLTDVTDSGRFDLDIQGEAATVPPRSLAFVLETLGTDFSDLTPIGPANNELISGSTEFTWSDAINAVTYTFELATSPSFSPESIVDTESGISGLSYTPPIVLENSTLYYWRVKGSNKCADDGVSPTFAFGTEALSCGLFEPTDLPKNISGTGTTTVESRIFIVDNGQVSDVNVKSVKGSHEAMSDLTMTLISPAGTEVTMITQRCFANGTFSMGFDDASPNIIACPLLSTFIPEMPLAAFSGEDIQGDWTLKVRDGFAGNGGRLDEFELELCSNKVLDGPQLVNNELLEVRRGFGAYVDDPSLLTEDANNTAAELIYTLVKTPEHGTLNHFGVPLEVGSQWRQSGINNNFITYQNDGSAENSDQFAFTVIDGEGGWIGLTDFNINITDDVDTPTATIDLDAPKEVFNIYPNPADQSVFVKQIDGTANEKWNGVLFDIYGRSVTNFTVRGNEAVRMETAEFSEGIYLLRLDNGIRTTTHSISIVH